MSDTPKNYESDTPETCEAVERWQQGKINIFDEMARLERERDEARDLAYKLYWVAWDLKRFARAYASGYKEADDEEGVAKAEEEFYETCRDIARILGMENPET